MPFPTPSAVAALRSDGKFIALIRNMGITFTETVMTKGLNFLLILVLARALGPSDYGRWSFIFVTMALASALFDFGMENTAVRFAAKDKASTDRIFGLYLFSKLVILAGLVSFFALGGGWFFGLLGKPDMAAYIPWLIMALLGESLFFVNDTYLQAIQRFRLRAVLNVTRYAACLAFAVSLVFNHQVMLETAFYIYLIPLAMTGLFVPRYVRFLAAWGREFLPSAIMSDIRHYQAWMAVYAIANNLLGRVDFFLLAYFVTYDQMGIYNAAFQLCAVVSFLPFVMGKVLLPALAEREPPDIFATVNRVIGLVSLMAVGGLILIPLVPWVVPVLLGHEYEAGVPVLQVLLIAFLAGMVTMPYEQGLYALGRPKLLSIGRYGQLILMVVFNILTIPLFGIMAVAMNALHGRLLYLVFVRHQYNALQKKHNPEGEVLAWVSR